MHQVRQRFTAPNVKYFINTICKTFTEINLLYFLSKSIFYATCHIIAADVSTMKSEDLVKVRNLQEYLQKLPQVGEQSDGIVKAVNLHLNRTELYISFFKVFFKCYSRWSRTDSTPTLRHALRSSDPSVRQPSSMSCGKLCYNIL